MHTIYRLTYWLAERFTLYKPAQSGLSLMPMNIALSGINAAFKRLRTTSNNIANVATPGFKQSRAETVESAAGGVKLTQIRPSQQQGQLNFTNNGLDLGITGNGYFQLNNQGETSYSRDGSFKLDKDGYIVNSEGKRLIGFHADTKGTLNGTTSDMRVDSRNGAPQATDSIKVGINLDATESVPGVAFDPNDPNSFNHTTSLNVHDSLGGNHQLDLFFRKTASPNVSEVVAYSDGKQVLGATALNFDNSGKLTSPAQVNIPAFSPGNGAADLNISLDTSEMSHYGSDFSISELSQNGSDSGRATGISIANDGIVSAQFSNGQSRVIGQVALANFSNPQALNNLGNNNFSHSHASGDATVGTPGTNNFGNIQSGSLETSNVNLEQQLIDLKVSRQEVQANAKVIKTQDEILGTLFEDKA